MTEKTYCILGGGGSFGINTALYLLDADPECRVVGIGRNPLRPEPFSLGVQNHPRYTYKTYHVVSELDMLLEYLDELCPDAIINFAAQGEGAVSWKHSWRFFDTNATALCRLYEALDDRVWFSQGWRAGTGCRFIHIGTSELYGSVEGPAREDASIVPSSPYAASKAAFDLYLLAMRRQQRAMNTVILRPCNAYCPGQLLHRIIPRAMVSGLTGRRVPLHGGGRARKSYIHIRDLARSIHIILAGGYVVSELDTLRPVYNIGSAFPISIRDLGHTCATVLGRDFDDLFYDVGERTGQDACYWLNSMAAREDLLWEPQVELFDGIEEVRDWAAANLDALRDWPMDYQLRA